MDKIIVTALLVIVGIISAVLVFNSVYPALGQSTTAIVSMQGRIDERLKSQIQIIHAVKSGDAVLIWVKNIGSLRIAAVEASDLFFGPEGNFTRVPYGPPGTPSLHWESEVENGTEWVPTTTLKITIVNYSPLDPGRYFVKVTIPNGIADEDYISW